MNANPLSPHDPQYHEAMRILKGLPSNSCTQLFKTTRAGATTGLCSTAVDAGYKYTLVAPTIAIALTTLEKSKVFCDINEPATSNIPGNILCKKNKKMSDKYPDIKRLPILPLPEKCEDCEHYHDCKVTKFLRTPNSEIYGVGLTHQKLNALMHSSSKTAQATLDKLMEMNDLVIIDEAHDLESGNAATVCVYPPPEMDKFVDVKNKYKIIRDFLDVFDRIRDCCKNDIERLLIMSGESRIRHMMIEVTDDDDPFGFTQVVGAIKAIITIMKHRHEWGLEADDVVFMNNVVMLLAGEHLVLHYISEDEVSSVLLSSPGSVHSAFHEYVMRCAIEGRNSKIVFTSATFGDFYYGNIFGLDITSTMMKDVCNTNEMMTIHPDTYKISTFDYWREDGHNYKRRIINAMKKYADKFPNIRFICMKKSVANIIDGWLTEEGYNIDVDYYRSDRTIGVDCDDRNIVCVGSPITSINAFDGVAKSYEESQRMRITCNHAAFWQSISRVKDPMGVEESHVYCIGIREDEIRMMCTWGIDRKIEVDDIDCLSVVVDDAEQMWMPKIITRVQDRVLNVLEKNGEMTRNMIMRTLHLSSSITKDALKSLIECRDVSSRVLDAKRKPTAYFIPHNR
jgi:hypothetical protein